MEDQIITQQTSKLALQKGITGVRTLMFYEGNEDGSVTGLDHWKFKDMDEHLDNLKLPVCTQSLLQKWLLKNHNLFIKIDWFQLTNDDDENITDGIDFDYLICKIGLHDKDYEPIIDYDCNRSFETPEEALEEALQKALALIKE